MGTHKYRAEELLRTLRHALLLTLLFIHAQPEKALAGTRADHWSGIDAAFAPYPSYGGVLAGVNLGDIARVSGGVGTAASWTTTQIDAKFFLTEKPIAPYIGAGLSAMLGSAGKFMFWDFSFDRAYVPFIQSGLDFTADVHEELNALHISVGVALGIPDGKIVPLPLLAIGVYF
jgi:hypothetical protein